MMNEPDFTGPVNLGNPDEFTIRQLAELVLELTGSQSRIIQRRLPADDPARRRPDISLARDRLGWEPVVALPDGLEQTIKWFKSVNLAQFRPPTPHY
jgi:UDP-glucuronate decarboxylase